jgi:hypothetical protein
MWAVYTYRGRLWGTFATEADAIREAKWIAGTYRRLS